MVIPTTSSTGAAEVLESFLVRAALAGVGVAVAAAPLGCFVVWRRMAYFGDAVAHAAILGVALALGFGISVTAGALIAALGMAVAVSGLSGRGLGQDTLLGVLAHSALAIGLVAVTLLGDVRVDLSAFLFGDILAVGPWDLAVIWGGGASVLGLLAWRWQALLAATLDPTLAAAAGIDARREGLVLTVAMAVVVAVAIKIVGALLIASLMIVPAAAARPFARTPERMAVVAAGIGAAAALAGLQASVWLDTPTGPSMVTAAAVAFVLSQAARR